MTYANTNTVRRWTVALAMLAATAFAQPIEPGQHASVEGVEIYYGLLPAQVVGKHPPTHEERTMHGGVSARKNAHHLVVALFDQAGERITGAQVQATVAELGMAGTRKRLEAMKIDDTTTYGGYFVLSGDGPYRIAIEARLPGAARPVEALFEYRRR